MTGAWPALVKAALLGTERTGRPAAVGGPGAVDALVDVMVADPERPAERALLACAGTLATARRAGRRAERPGVEAPPPAPPVDRPEPGQEAARTRAALLGGTWRQLLPEWLEVCADRGMRVPSALLPSALDVATADRSLRPAVLAALGERGRWLAGQRAEWAWAGGPVAGGVPDDPAAAWAEGTAGERRALLAAVRAVDPVLGRALVEATWRTDRADDRAAFVDLLAVGLSMDDEPFLEERARLDRAKDVRRAATAALARLPSSRLALRMRDRALAHVQVGARWAVRLPDQLPEDWVADGITPARRGAGGERAGWLAQVVASAPLDAWGPAAEAVRSASGADHGQAMLQGWSQATGRQHRPDWAVALLDASVLPDPAALLRVLEPAARAGWLARALQAMPPGGAARLLPLAAEVPRPWPAALVQVAAGRAAALVLALPLQARLARPVLVLAAERAGLPTLPGFAAQMAQAGQADRRLQSELRRPLAIAQLRVDLLAELAPPP